MRGVRTDLDIIRKIKYLRKNGNSVLEISQQVSRSKSIVSKYIQGVSIPLKYQSVLDAKQGGSKIRSLKAWDQSNKDALEIIGMLSRRDRILILAALYWGEGTKSELNIINSDPLLLRVFILCLSEIGVDSRDIKVTLRIFQDISKEQAIDYWSKVLVLPKGQILNVNVLEGKKKGKLKYGMCRIRIAKGSKYFKLIMSLIKGIKTSFLLP